MAFHMAQKCDKIYQKVNPGSMDVISLSNLQNTITHTRGRIYPNMGIAELVLCLRKL